MSVFDWLAAPFRAVRSCFPFGPEGRGTIVILAFAGAGPALTLFLYWAMKQLEAAKQWGPFASLAEKIAWCVIILVSSIGGFISLRSLKIGPFEASSFGPGRDDSGADPKDPTQ